MDERYRPSAAPETDPVSLVGTAVLDALEQIALPAYVIDPNGTIRWTNRAVTELLGAPGGRQRSFVLPDMRRVVRAHLAHKVAGGEWLAYKVTALAVTARSLQLRLHALARRGLGEQRFQRR
jgi:hypothetical protein